ncbi:MAG: EamA/RhaT family transporter, partial [Paracoccaceae bacterium]
MPRAPDQILRGICLMLGFCILAPLQDVASKLATTDIPVGQITTARFIVQGALMVPVILLMGLNWRVSGRMVKFLAQRAFFLILSNYFFVMAVAVM